MAAIIKEETRDDMIGVFDFNADKYHIGDIFTLCFFVSANKAAP